jgi:uncharacterized membrane protein
LAGIILFSGGGGFTLETMLSTLGVSSMEELIRSTLQIRVTGSWTALYLGAMIASAVVLLRRRWRDTQPATSQGWIAFLIILGALLVIGPEFLYLRDQFGLRMNTIFKFYFSAWILWSLAGGMVLINLWRKRTLRWIPVQIGAMIPLLLGLVYPVFSVWTKTEQFNPSYGRSLDGSLHPGYMNTDDRDAINWMNAYLPDGIVA